MTRSIILGLASWVLLIGMSVGLVSTKPSFQLAYSLTGLSDTQSQKLKEVAYNSQQVLIAPITANQAAQWWSDIRLGVNFAYTRNEVSHLSDVKAIFNCLMLAAMISFGVLVIALMLRLQSTLASIKKAIKILFITIAAIATSAVLFWNQFFIVFHQILFPQGNWEFYASSTLITLFPVQFWQTIAGLLFASILLLTIITHELLKRLSADNTHQESHKPVASH